MQYESLWKWSRFNWNMKCLFWDYTLWDCAPVSRVPVISSDCATNWGFIFLASHFINTSASVRFFNVAGEVPVNKNVREQQNDLKFWTSGNWYQVSLLISFIIYFFFWKIAFLLHNRFYKYFFEFFFFFSAMECGNTEWQWNFNLKFRVHFRNAIFSSCSSRRLFISVARANLQYLTYPPLHLAPFSGSRSFFLS